MNSFKKKVLVLLALFLSFLSFNQNKKDTSALSFEYEIYSYKLNGDNIVTLKCKLNNLSDKDIYFMNYSCNGLKYSVFNEVPSITAFDFVNCNATFPKKEKILPTHFYEFEIYLKRSNGDEITEDKISPILELILVDKNFIFERPVGYYKDTIKSVFIEGTRK